MVRLFEHEAKKIFREFKIPTPRGELASTPQEAEAAARRIGCPAVLKAQVLTGGRGKAGGIRVVERPEDALPTAELLLKSSIGGFSVRGLLVEEKLDIDREYYLGLAVERSSKTHVLLASSKGGVDIEEVAQAEPEKIVKVPLHPLKPFREFHARRVARRLGCGGERLNSFTHIILSLVKAALEKDAELAEINPLAETSDGRLVAADARVVIDDNALFRQRDIEALAAVREGEASHLENDARRLGMSYVELEGDVGIIGNGAGLVMATLDLVQYFGGTPANFLDIGGGATEELVKAALKIVTSKRGVKSVCVNILGGITRCDLVARGILHALSELSTKPPISIRIVGTNEEEAKGLLQAAGLQVHDSMEEVVKAAITMARSERD